MPVSKLTILATAAATLGPPLSSAGDWPHYLGPHADTTVRETGILTTFPDSGLDLVWSKPAGGGYSSPAVTSDRVFLMDRVADPYQPGEINGNPNFIRAHIPGSERVSALDATNGDTIWTHRYNCPYSTAFPYATGPRCTPTVDADRVYTLGAEGNLFCLSTSDGKILWSRDFKKDYALKIPEWGCAAHPLVHGDQLIGIVGGEGTTVVSFDKTTGEENWRALSSPAPGYCPPTIATIHGLEQLIVWHGKAVVSLDPENGTTNWSQELKPAYGMSIGAPRVYRDLVFAMGYNGVSATIKVAPDNRSADLVWGPDLRKGVAGVFNTAHLSPTGHIYSAGRNQIFRCIDIHTGNRLWESDIPLKNATGNGSRHWSSAFTFHHPPSGHTFIYNDHGELISTKLTPQGYTEVSRTRLIPPTHKVGHRTLVWSAPAFANRHVFVRNDSEIRCYNIAAP
ncbi:MAG: PQQ-like beta-propeller repeat protein [Verrucomicrobiales bacterium]|nr:PQQ-like beta-propeller repeat protein [Verrucomicrobiales bacterium]